MKHIEDKIKSLGLSDSTVKTYSNVLSSFFSYYNKKDDYTIEEINHYLDYLLLEKKYKARSRNLVAKVISFYCREFLRKEVTIRKSKEDKPLPKICEDDDFSRILAVTHNPKHRLCLLLMRYSGLRRWEVIRLMKHHILTDGRLLVECGKGAKDRYTIIPPQVLELLRPYIELLPTDNPYIFQGQSGIGHYSSMTPNRILINAFNNLGWHKERWFGVHSLRHAFTLWCVDTLRLDFDEVSKMLGHSIMRTSQIYTQCRKVNLKRAIDTCNQTTIIGCKSIIP